MNNSKIAALSGLIALFVSMDTAAEDKPIDKSGEGAVQAEAELGIIVATGNTETSSYKAKLLIKQETENWKNNFLLDGLYKEDELLENGVKENQVTAEKYFTSAQGDYKLNEAHSALFVFASYEDDRFSGYEYQGSFALGYSDQVFGNEVSFLNFNVGPGYSFNETDAGLTDETAMVRIALAYEYKLSSHAKFNQGLSTEMAMDNDSNEKSKSESAITANLLGSLSLKAAYSISHNSEVDAGKEHTDAITSVSVVYVF